MCLIYVVVANPAVCMYELTFSRESARPNFAKQQPEKAEMQLERGREAGGRTSIKRADSGETEEL
jgi:hypothetical protein